MLLSSKIVVFSFGFCIGFFLFIVTHTPKKKEVQKKQDLDVHSDAYRLSYKKWLKEKGVEFVKADLDELYYSKNRRELKKKLESQFLYDLVHVTCVVFVKIQKNAYLIDSTWGHKCNSIIYYSTVKDDFINTYTIPFTNKWQYLCESLQHLWLNTKKLQWVLFSPDDVFVIPENVRYFVATKDFNKPYYFGHNVVFWQQIYNSDKTSFLLSRGAIKALLERFNSSEACQESRGINDAVFNLGKHLSELGIHAGDSRDHKGRERFHIFTLLQLVADSDEDVIIKNSRTSLHPVKQGKDCCSDTSISFRIPQLDGSFLLTYFLYNLHVFYGGNAANRHTVEKEQEEVWKVVVRELFGINGNLSKITAEKYRELWNAKISNPEQFNEKIRKEFQRA